MAEADKSYAEPTEVEHELAGTRDRLGGLLGELSRRRRELTNVGLQLRKHTRAIAITAGGVLATMATLIGLGLRRRARQRRLPERARRLRAALGRMVAHPERVGRAAPGLGGSLLKAALTAAVATVAKRLVSGVARGPRRTPPPAQPPLLSGPTP
jgi:hypothetical protein